MPGGARSHGAPDRLVALTDEVERAAAENAEGHPARAARRLRPALARLDALDASPEVERVRVRAVLELAKSDFEVRADASAALARLAELAQARGRGEAFAAELAFGDIGRPRLSVERRLAD